MPTNRERGIIYNRGRAKQISDFSGLRFGNITPTDVDLMIEYKDICYIFAELKHRDAPMPYGQKLALERLCDDMQKIKPTLLILASHDSDGDINVSSAVVTAIRWRGQWRDRGGVTVREVIEKFIAWAEKDWFE